MSVETEPSAQKDFGSLQGCFVDGSVEQRARERRIRRRALIISVTIQSAIVAVIVLIPLFGKPERVALAMTPIPPYFHQPSRPPADPAPTHPYQPHTPRFCPTCYPPIRPDQQVTGIDKDPEGDPLPPGIPSGPGQDAPCVGCIPIADGRRQPERPAEVRPQTPRRITVTRIEPAMLIQRVEPVYPPLARQIHREGRVELRAIIATDGTIQSLQVVSGDPLFLQSAVDAVRQWRYRATVLNGQAVEIDTYITVIYSLQH